MKIPISLQTILDTANLSGRHVVGLRGDFLSRLEAFQYHRSEEEQQELTEDFSRVLAAWGIADADIPGVITSLRLRLPIFLAPMLACLVAGAYQQSLAAYLALVCIVPPCLFGMVTTLWRISILRHRRFTPLCRWLLHFHKRP